MSSTPKDKIINIKVKGEDKPWLPAHEAITWFRDDYPGAQSRITTRIEDWDLKIVLAEIWIRSEDGVMELVSTARSMGDGVKSLEKLETSAIRRALAYLGYGTTAAMSYDDHPEEELTPEERARIAKVNHDQTPEDKQRVRQNMGSGPGPRRIDTSVNNDGAGAGDNTIIHFAPGFDSAYFYSAISDRFNGMRHRDNALAKMFREGLLNDEMDAESAIESVYRKYPDGAK